MATLPPGLPVWLRWTLAAPMMLAAAVGPPLALVLVGAAGVSDRGNRAVMQVAEDLYGSVWFVFAFAVPGVVAAAVLWRQLVAWRSAYLVTSTIVVALWTVSDTLFDATEHDARQPWIVPLAVGLATWLAGYLLAMSAIRILTRPGARLADSSMEMAVPLRGRPSSLPWKRGWIRMQWDRVRIEAGGKTGTAVLAWSALRSVQAGDLTSDHALRVAEIDSPRPQPMIFLSAGPGVRFDGDPGTLYASCDDSTLVAEAVAARVAWASLRPGTERPDLDEATARREYEDARDVFRFAPLGTPTGAPALVTVAVALALLTGISIYLGIYHGRQDGRPAHTIVIGSVLASVFAGLDVCAVHLLRNYVRGQRFLEANDEAVPDQPVTPWLARAEAIVVRPDLSEHLDEPFVRNRPVRSARREKPRRDRRRR